MAKKVQPTEADAGAAFLEWYAESLKAYPDGLVTQAQAAKMLAIGRMAVSRLITRGYLRAVYFPKPPAVEGFALGEDDPTWLRLVSQFGHWIANVEFPEACYVAFGDVVELWLRGDAAQKCRLTWRDSIKKVRSEQADVQAQGEAIGDLQDREQLTHINGRYFSDSPMSLTTKKIAFHAPLLDWFQAKATKLGITRNQLIFASLERFKAFVEGEKNSSDEIRLPTEWEAELIDSRAWSTIREKCKGSEGYVKVLDDLNGEVGVWGSRGVEFYSGQPG